MLTAVKFIPKELQEKIKAAARIEEVVEDYEVLSKRGTQLKGDCPFCRAKKKFDVNLQKSIWKCWVCNEGGKTSIDFLMKKENIDYIEALVRLADKYNISLEDEAPKKNNRKSRKQKFRNLQLKESGIKDKEQKWTLHSSEDTYIEIDRFQAASIEQKTWAIVPGDDMILNYVGLDGKLMHYVDEKGKKRPFYRIRYQNPNLHKNRDGQPMKYQSPRFSQSKIWFPNSILQAYKQKAIIETLTIIEGEKKAEAMCNDGIPTVAVGGIHNFSKSGDMPYEFELLIKVCGISKVVWMLDADWQDIKVKDPMKPVESRPNLFYLSVSRFREYFKNYHFNGIDLDIYFGHGIDPLYKGMDDLLVKGIQKEGDLKEDFAKAIKNREGKGEHVNIYKITETTEYKLKEFWNLHSRPKFFNEHQEELRKFREFKYGKLTYRWNEEAEEFELSQKIMPHEQYWHEMEVKGKTKYSFNYVAILEFLKNRGFGLYKLDSENFHFIHIESKIIRQINAQEIQRYVLDFTRSLGSYQMNQILEMLLRGGKQYLGQDKLSNMFYLTPQLNRADKHRMFLYFKNCYWEITKDGITSKPLKDLSRHIWDDKIIDFEPKLGKEPYLKAERKGEDWKVKFSKDFNKCEMAQFYFKTSFFHWRKHEELKESDDGTFKWVERKKPEADQHHDRQLLRSNLIAKMVAAGYLLHDHIDFGNMKAVIAMDGLESEVGQSNGGTGKGVYCTAFERLVPVHWVNGKRKDLNDDKHIFGGVDERTQIIYFEDVRVNFDFENLFPTITRGTWVEKKGVDGHREDPKKILLDTNHALNADGNSAMRRQFLISFSDYYNRYRTVRDDFGHNFYDEWEYEQWNHFYNFMATCMQLYLQHGLKYSIPTKALERRKLRQGIGESFLEWATLMFHTTEDDDGKKGKLLNHRIEKSFLYGKYAEQAPKSELRYLDTRKFKFKLRKYCEYAGLEWNPPRKGKEDDRIISNAKELFIVADKDFQLEKAKTIMNEGDLKNLEKELPF